MNRKVLVESDHLLLQQEELDQQLCNNMESNKDLNGPSIESTNNEENINTNSFSMKRIIIYSIIGCWPAINFGYSLGYPGYHTTVIMTTNTVQNSNQISLYNSIILIGALFGALTATYLLMTRYGRKNSIIVGSIFAIIGWSIHLIYANITISSKFPIIHLLIFARFIVGMSVGISSTASPVYAVEISPPKAFKYTGGFHQIGITLGFIIVSTVAYITEKFDNKLDNMNGFTVSRLYLPLTILIIVVIQLILAVFLPYVPSWLVSSLEKTPENEDYIHKNHLKLYDSEYQFNNIIKSFQSKNYEKDTTTGSIYNKQNLTAFFTVTMLFFFQQMIGINPVLFNSQMIFRKVGLTSDTLGSLIASFGQFFGALICAITNAYVPKKITLVVGSLICVVTHLVLGIQTQFLQENTNVAPLAVAMIFTFYIAFNTCWGPIPFIYNAFSYSSNAVGVFSGLGVMFSWLISFVATYPYFYLEKALNVYGTFYLFSIISILAAIYSALIVPEIKNKDISQVPQLFGKLMHPSFK